MENIRQAIERAKAGSSFQRRPTLAPATDLDQQSRYSGAQHFDAQPEAQEIELNSAHLQAHRIISYGTSNPLSRPFDMLRTQVLQTMDAKGWKVLAVTSPTAACGKTVTAVNLALSIARSPERSVLITDLDLPRPKLSECLGLQTDIGVLSVLRGETLLADSITHTYIGNQRLGVLPTRATSGSSELLSSRSMGDLFQDFRSGLHGQTIIVDLPPILASDDVISILPHVDCVLLVVAVGTTKISEIEECNRHLQASQVIRIVVNKVRDAAVNYYYY
jgi:protein-tyrosine kinase